MTQPWTMLSSFGFMEDTTAFKWANFGVSVRECHMVNVEAGRWTNTEYLWDPSTWTGRASWLNAADFCGQFRSSWVGIWKTVGEPQVGIHQLWQPFRSPTVRGSFTSSIIPFLRSSGYCWLAIQKTNGLKVDGCCAAISWKCPAEILTSQKSAIVSTSTVALHQQTTVLISFAGSWNLVLSWSVADR